MDFELNATEPEPDAGGTPITESIPDRLFSTAGTGSLDSVQGTGKNAGKWQRDSPRFTQTAWPASRRYWKWSARRPYTASDWG